MEREQWQHARASWRGMVTGISWVGAAILSGLLWYGALRVAAWGLRELGVSLAKF